MLNGKVKITEVHTVYNLENYKTYNSENSNLKMFVPSEEICICSRSKHVSIKMQKKLNYNLQATIYL